MRSATEDKKLSAIRVRKTSKRAQQTEQPRRRQTVVGGREKKRRADIH